MASTFANISVMSREAEQLTMANNLFLPTHIRDRSGKHGHTVDSILDLAPSFY